MFGDAGCGHLLSSWWTNWRNKNGVIMIPIVPVYDGMGIDAIIASEDKGRRMPKTVRFVNRNRIIVNLEKWTDTHTQKGPVSICTYRCNGHHQRQYHCFTASTSQHSSDEITGKFEISELTAFSETPKVHAVYKCTIAQNSFQLTSIACCH